MNLSGLSAGPQNTLSLFTPTTTIPLYDTVYKTKTHLNWKIEMPSPVIVWLVLILKGQMIYFRMNNIHFTLYNLTNEFFFFFFHYSHYLIKAIHLLPWINWARKDFNSPWIKCANRILVFKIIKIVFFYPSPICASQSNAKLIDAHTHASHSAITLEPLLAYKTLL